MERSFPRSICHRQNGVVEGTLFRMETRLTPSCLLIFHLHRIAIANPIFNLAFTVAIIRAIIESAETGKRVDLVG